MTFDLFVQKKFSESNISEDKERKKKVLLYLPSFTTVFSPPLLALRNVSTIISIFIDHEWKRDFMIIQFDTELIQYFGDNPYFTA